MLLINVRMRCLVPAIVCATFVGCSDRDTAEAESGENRTDSVTQADVPVTEDEPVEHDSKTPFATLVKEASDFDLVDSTFVKIGDRYEHWVDASKYTAEERVIMLVWHSSGIIDNGGFEYLFGGSFDGDPGFAKTAEAYKSAGLKRGHQAFKDAFKLFPDGKVPEQREVRLQQYLATDESVREKINEMHWKDGWEDLREKALAKFIRDNASKLGYLK